MKKKFNFPWLCWRACLALGLAIALAFPAIAYNPYGDPSARVARLNFIQGDVSLQPGGEDEWVWASTNRPLTTSDSIWTGRGSRAELHIGSTAIRVAPRTSFSFLNLDDNNVQIELNAGTLNVRVRNLYRGDTLEVDTPNIAFTLLQRGDYRITVDPDGTFTTVTVRSGEGQVTGGGQAFYVDAGSQVQVTGTDYITYDVYDLPVRDSFDRWAYARDVRESRSTSARYVTTEMTGYEDLDRYGNWRTDSNLGPIWVPTRVTSNWAPYRYGHWAWVDPWGWTWVDDAQFGFVTSHYGRWASLDNGYGQTIWAWVPPRREQTTYQRPVYAPALVTFISTSSQYGNNVIWVPLAPGEVYVPSFKASPTYVQQVNLTNTAVRQQTITTAVNNPQQVAPSQNQKVTGAVTSVPKTAFVNAQPVAAAAVKVDQQAVATAPAAPAAPVAPVKASVVAASASTEKAAAPAPRPPVEVEKRQVVAKAAPPLPPVPFEKKQQALAATPGKPLDPRVEQNLRAATPAPAAEKPVITVPPAAVKPAAEMPKKPQPAVSPNVAKQEHPATPATGAPPPGQQRAEIARQQAAQRQAEREQAQQLAAQQQAEKEKAQQGAAAAAKQQAETARQQAEQQRIEKEKAQQLAAQQQAEKEKAQQQAAQQQAEKQRAQQQALQAQQQAERARQQAAQQQAEKEKAQQLTAQQQAEKEKAQQQAAQQQAEKQKAQQQAAQAQREAERARQQAAQQQAEKERAQQLAAQQQAEKEKAQQLAAQQQADRARERERQQMAQERPPATPPEKAQRPAPPEKAPEAQTPSGPLRVPENEQAAKLVTQPQLNAPPNAHGVVRVRVVIGTDGRVKNATALSGPPPLRAAALENVRQRVYQPTLVNGRPVEVETEVSIRF